MSAAAIASLVALITSLLPAGVTLVEDIKTLISKHAIPPDQFAAFVVLLAQEIANTNADTVTTATADLAINTSTAVPTPPKA